MEVKKISVLDLQIGGQKSDLDALFVISSISIS